MKLIGLTQRVVSEKNYVERRDALDQSWFSFFDQIGTYPIAVPNSINWLSHAFEKDMFKGFILTGGNDPSSYNGDAPERDEIEFAILDYAFQKKLPIIGVCRGMQMLHLYSDGELHSIEGHVCTEHDLIFRNKSITVNSYHKLGIQTVTKDYRILSQNKDGVVEAMEHKSLPWLGVMWHPERCQPFNSVDFDIFREFFKI